MKATRTNLTLLTIAGILGVACSSGSSGGRDAGLGDFGFGDVPEPAPVAVGGALPYATGGTRHTGGHTLTGGTHTGGSRAATGGAMIITAAYTGGTRPTGGTTSTGGRMSTGGALTGGRTSTGGTSNSTSTAAACSGRTVPQSTGTLTVASTYVTTGTLQGYGFTWVGSGSNSTTCITPTCGSTGCSPAFGTTALCAAGDVTADTTYNSIVGIGFNVNQPTTGGTAGSVAAPSSITVAVTKGTSAGDSALRVTLVERFGQ